MLPKTPLTVAALYHFARLADPAARQEFFALTRGR